MTALPVGHGDAATAWPCGPRAQPPVVLTGDGLALDDIIRVAYARAQVQLGASTERRQLVDATRAMVVDGVATGRTMYGVTTGFGGMADRRVAANAAAELQSNLLSGLHVGLGDDLQTPIVRAAMLLRANSHLHGVSGLRTVLIQRLVDLLNLGITPVVKDLGSIGASGDLVPLAAIAGAAIGRDGYSVRWHGQPRPAVEVLGRCGLPRLQLEPKEGLAMVNGTSVSTAWGLDTVWATTRLFRVTLAFHALAIVALGGDGAAFDDFIHVHKPHPGQRRVAAALLRAIGDGDRWTTDHHAGLAQDRYAVRCLPQFLGPVLDTIERVEADLLTEANSATDNPLFDVERDRVLNGGNFLAQYVATGLDALRAQVALMTKHVDVQLAQLMAPPFSNGLPPSLIGDAVAQSNMGLKGLQIAGNSIMPLVAYLGAPLADRFPTHAEEFNQNINSQSYGSARLSAEQLSLARTHMACALLAVVQAVELRGGPVPAMLAPVIDAVRRVGRLRVGLPIRGDADQDVEHLVSGILDDLETGGAIDAAAASIVVPLADDDQAGVS